MKVSPEVVLKSALTIRLAWIGLPENVPAFASKQDVLAAVEHMTSKVKQHIIYNEKVVDAVFDEDEKQWVVKTEAGTVVKAPWLTVANGSLGDSLQQGFNGVLSNYTGKVSL